MKQPMIKSTLKPALKLTAASLLLAFAAVSSGCASASTSHAHKYSSPNHSRTNPFAFIFQSNNSPIASADALGSSLFEQPHVRQTAIDNTSQDIQLSNASED